MHEKLFRVPECSQYFGVEERLVYKLLGTKQLRGVRVGRLWRIPESALSEFLQGGGCYEESQPAAEGRPH